MRKIMTVFWLLAFIGGSAAAALVIMLTTTGAAFAGDSGQPGLKSAPPTMDDLALAQQEKPLTIWAEPNNPTDLLPGITIIVPSGSDVTIKDTKDNRIIVGDVKNGLRITGTVTGTTITVGSVKSK